MSDFGSPVMTFFLITICDHEFCMTLRYSFANVREGMHVLLRDFNFMRATPHNRASFVYLFWRCFANIARKTGTATSLLLVRFYDLIITHFNLMLAHIL